MYIYIHRNKKCTYICTYGHIHVQYVHECLCIHKQLSDWPWCQNNFWSHRTVSHRFTPFHLVPVLLQDFDNEELRLVGWCLPSNRVQTVLKPCRLISNPVTPIRRPPMHKITGAKQLWLCQVASEKSTCLYKYVCARMYFHISVLALTYVWTWVWIWICICIYTYVHYIIYTWYAQGCFFCKIYAYTYTCTYICMNMNMNMKMNMNMNMDMDMYIYIDEH